MSESSNTRLPRWMLAAVALGAALAGAILFSLWLRPVETDAQLPADLQQHYLIGTKPVVGIAMTDQSGQPFTEARFKGHWTFLFFGFTNCPDVCPTTMLTMQQVWKQLPDKAKSNPSPQLVFVSVDPDRDTQDKLKDYVSYYNPEFIAIRGAHDKLDILVNQVGALYGYEDGPDKEHYTVMHSAQLILIDPQGNMRGIFSPPLEPGEIARSFVRIRDYYKG